MMQSLLRSPLYDLLYKLAGNSEVPTVERPTELLWFSEEEEVHHGSPGFYLKDQGHEATLVWQTVYRAFLKWRLCGEWEPSPAGLRWSYSGGSKLKGPALRYTVEEAAQATDHTCSSLALLKETLQQQPGAMDDLNSKNNSKKKSQQRIDPIELSQQILLLLENGSNR